MTSRLYLNTNVQQQLTANRSTTQPLDFHRRLPGYAPSPLVPAPGIAATLGVGKLWVKDESQRLNLPSFKILGASWATYRAIAQLLGREFAPWATIAELAAQLTSLRPLRLVAATDGNHGRAVAHIAALLGFSALIYVPSGTAPARISAIQGEGAEVVVVDGSYDDAVILSAQQAGDRSLVISDTSWPGYEAVPSWVVEGYSTIFAEVDAQLAAMGEMPPDLVAVQMGVGALAASVVLRYRHGVQQPRIVGVEPLAAACILSSMEAGRMIAIPGPHDSIMAGLNCGLPSEIAWPLVSTGIDLFVAVADERSRQAMRLLAAENIVAGETGAAGLAGLLDLLSGDHSAHVRQTLNITPATTILAISTEGATDPLAYDRIVNST